jgi:hypothetical protein
MSMAARNTSADPCAAPIYLETDGCITVLDCWSANGFAVTGRTPPSGPARLRVPFRRFDLVFDTRLRVDAEAGVVQFEGLGQPAARALDRYLEEARTRQPADLLEIAGAAGPPPPARGTRRMAALAVVLIAGLLAIPERPAEAPAPRPGLGAEVSVDGITRRLAHVYEPGSAFFSPPRAAAPPEAQTARSDILSAAAYGAVPDPSVDNLAALQAAIDAAHAQGGGVVLLEPGTYGIAGAAGRPGALHLKSNTFLKGAGMGVTVLRVLDSWDGKLTGIVRTPWGEPTGNYGLADLTLDGNRQNAAGKVDGFYSGGRPGGAITDEDAWVLRVEARHNSGYGFDPHERTERLVIRDSVAHKNGLDGFVADYVIDGVYEGLTAYDNDRHGFNIVTTSNDLLLRDSVARDNGGAGLVVQRGSFPIAAPHNLRVEGLALHGNARDGALVQMSHDVHLSDLDVRGNGTYGVRIMGSQRVTVSDSTILDNARQRAGGFAAIQIRDNADPDVMQRTYPARGVLITGNTLGWSRGVGGRAGVEERPGRVGGNVVQGNAYSGRLRARIRLAAPDSTARDQWPAPRVWALERLAAVARAAPVPFAPRAGPPE